MRRVDQAPRAEAQVDTVTGRVERLFFSSPEFSAGVLATPEGETKFAGKLMVQEGDRVILRGRWEDGKWGRQLKVASLEYDLPTDAVGLAHYLSNHPAMKGIGPVKARAIAQEFGADFDRALQERPEAVAKAARVPLAVIQNLAAEWARTRSFNLANTWLASFELTHHQISTLVKKYGNSVVAIFKADPYRLIGEIEGYGFKRVDVIARKMGTPKDHASRIRGGILHCVNETISEGHCWIEHDDLVDLANKDLTLDTLDSREIIAASIQALVKERQLVSEQVEGHLLVSRPDLRRMETDLASTFLGGRDPNPNAAKLAKALAGGLQLTSALNPGQRLAVETALRHSLTVMTGGAGVGKTFTVRALCDLYQAAGLEVLLCAPTGKAAKRLNESTGREASTIHRLLEYNGQEFQFEGVLDADLLVVDEVSMVDVPLCWHLLRAVDLARTAVLLVGDHHQLPPVGPGNILRDLVATQAVPVVVLDQVVRQAGILKENCSAVLSGTVAPSAPAQAGTLRPWYKLGDLQEPQDLLAFVRLLYESKLTDDLGLDPVAEIQLLTPTRKGPMGVAALNAELQRVVQRKLFGVEVEPVAANRRPKFLKGDKVIQRRNNYALGVMNGTLGQVRSVDPGTGDLVVAFDGKEVTLQRSEGHLSDLDLAYALTIHQTQGSEFPVVIVLVHKAHSFQHHRNLLYTGVTRAKRAAIILGDHWGIRNCASRVETDKRRTWLSLVARNPKAPAKEVSR